MESDPAGSLERSADGCYVALTHDLLNMQQVTDRVRSPAAGAIVLFAGVNLLPFP
jgi:molybdopterin synthase catalytic subunit